MAHEEIRKNRAATFYKVATLNKWFLWSSVALTICYVWTVVEDHQQPWKEYQRTFMDLEVLTAEGQAAAVWGPAQNSQLAGLLDQLDVARARLESDPIERPMLVAALEQAEFEFAVAEAEMKQAKSIFEAERFHFEEEAHVLEGEDGVPHDIWNPRTVKVQRMLETYVEKKSTFEERDEVTKTKEANQAAALAALQDHDRLVSDVQEQIDLNERQVNSLERIMHSNDRGRFFTTFRNSLFFDFLAPSITPHKIVTSELQAELNFLQVPRIDMCITCHLATSRHQDYAWENPPAMILRDDEGKVLPEERVYLAHSRPELFCTSLSPHDEARFGCSGCHQGNHQRLSFQGTFHTPTDEAEAERWEDEYHWHEGHYWDYPMLSSKFIESSCYKCHLSEIEIPGATKWNQGRRLVERFGCFGCHTMEPMEGVRKAGPPLYHVVSKYQSPEWALKWVEEPGSFRPSTPMPQFFHLENHQNNPERQRAEIASIIQYVYNLATPIELDSYPGDGDAERGKRLFGEGGGIGCMACHNINDFPSEEWADEERHGPELSGVGSKVTADWLYTWLMDPSTIWEETRMPNLRLTTQEAADLTAYLMTKRNLEFENRQFRRPSDESIYDEILVEKYTERMTEARARDEVAAMSSLDKRLQAGEYLVNHHGCFGCHLIEGYEETKPIGTELNGWGSKHADRLDFGVFYLDWKKEGKFKRETWLEQKLINTRFFDRGKDRAEFEKLKMPQFRFGNSEEEHLENMEAVMTYVLSLTKDHLDDSILRHLSPAETAVQRGKRLVEDKNCNGCHVIYGVGGEIQDFIGKEDTDTAYYPPLLNGQGARTQHDWLFAFLNDPSMAAGRGSKAHLRPWMRARMPTFNFTQDQLNDMVAYFAHEELWHTAENRVLWDSLVEKFREDFSGYTARDLRLGDADKNKLFMALVTRLYKQQGGTFLHETDFPYLGEVGTQLTAAEGKRGHDFFEQLDCANCHQPGGNPPAGKSEADMAPPLDLTLDRLQPKWVENWFRGPALYQPGTRMPNLWPVDDPATGLRQSNHDTIQDADEEMRLMRRYLFSERFQKEYSDFTLPSGGR